jgi:hypothetical protein
MPKHRKKQHCMIAAVPDYTLGRFARHCKGCRIDLVNATKHSSNRTEKDFLPLYRGKLHIVQPNAKRVNQKSLDSLDKVWNSIGEICKQRAIGSRIAHNAVLSVIGLRIRKVISHDC